MKKLDRKALLACTSSARTSPQDGRGPFGLGCGRKCLASSSQDFTAAASALTDLAVSTSCRTVPPEHITDYYRVDGKALASSRGSKELRRFKRPRMPPSVFHSISLCVSGPQTSRTLRVLLCGPLGFKWQTKCRASTPRTRSYKILHA